MIYVASPFSHPDKRVKFNRVCETARLMAKLQPQHEEPLYSPILHWYMASRLCALPDDAAYWESLNTQLIKASSAVIVLTIAGWKSSIGVKQEIALAKELQLPIHYFNAEGLHRATEITFGPRSA